MRASDPQAVNLLASIFGDGIKMQSALCEPGTRLTEALAGCRFRRILEIGTFQGLTAAVLADYADSVVTLDIQRQPTCEQVWDIFDVKSKITQIIVKDNAEKGDVVRGQDFDMAFIDGAHGRQEVAFDFGIVRQKCQHALFHDYPFAVPWGDPIPMTYCYHEHQWNDTGDGVGFLLDVIQPAGQIERIPPFAWWRAK